MKIILFYLKILFKIHRDLFSQWKNEPLKEKLIPTIIGSPKNIENIDSPSDIIFTLWDDKIIDHIVIESNNYVPKIRKKSDPKILREEPSMKIKITKKILKKYLKSL